jgi:hypothetical protein
MFEHLDSPSIDQILDSFGRDDPIARHPATSRRSADTRTRLLAYLATDAAQVLVPDARVLLTAERQFAPDGAFTRVFGAEVLVAALPGFLEPGWLPRHVYDARAQVRFVELLLDWTVAHGLVDAGEMSCIIYGVLDSARAARRSLGAGTRESESHPTLDDPADGPMPGKAGPSTRFPEGAQTLPGLERTGPVDGGGSPACSDDARKTTLRREPRP